MGQLGKGGLGRFGEVGGTPSRGSSQLSLVPSLPAAGLWGLGVPGIGTGSGSGPDSLFPAGWCDPLNPNGSWRSWGRAVLPASCTQWPWDCPSTPGDTPGTSPHPSMGQGAEGDTGKRTVGTGGWGSGCGKKAVLALLSFLTWTRQDFMEFRKQKF